MTRRRVAVVMPAYNETSGIGVFLEEICASFRSAGWEPVIGVVDDCSTDGTLDTVKRFAEHSPCDVTVVSNETNRGHGPSSIHAWKLGGSFETEIVLHVDGDGQFHADDMLRIVAACEDADGALGVRVKRSDPWFRRVVTWSLRRYVRALSGQSITDANSPLRAYKTRELERLLVSVPEASLVPSVYLAVAGMTESLFTVEVNVVSYERRGETTTGSMWGDAKVSFLPSRRLVRFVWRAIGESARVLRQIRAERTPNRDI